MQSSISSLARLLLIGASLLLLPTPLAFGQPPLPRPKPAIVIDRVVQVEEAPAPAPAAMPSASQIATDEAVWSAYRLTWLLAAIGLAVIALSVWQALAARDASRRRLRAYIGARPGAAPDLHADWTDATVILKNHGTTPAFALDHATTLMMLDYPEPVLENVMGAADKMFGKKSFVLAPGAEMTVALRTVLSDDEKHETEDGTHKRLCALGEVRYLDAFKVKHRTRFCFVYGGSAIIASGEMQIADKGNEAD